MNFLSGFVSDLTAAVIFALLTVFTLGVLFALGWAWESFISFVFRIPKD